MLIAFSFPPTDPFPFFPRFVGRMGSTRTPCVWVKVRAEQLGFAGPLGPFGNRDAGGIEPVGPKITQIPALWMTRTYLEVPGLKSNLWLIS